MEQEIILSEEALHRRQQIAMLRAQVAELYEQRESMVSYERQNLIAQYTNQIGKWQYEEYALKVAVMRLKRKVQLIQTHINRGEQINLQHIEQQLEVEFSEYQQLLEEQLESVRAAQAFLAAPILTEDDANDLKRIYRILVKRLHPDWNPNLPQEKQDLFVRAQAAYKNADVQELRNILLMLDADDKPQTKDDTVQKTIEQLKRSIADLTARIDKLEQSFPFNMRDKLSDEKWIAQRQKEIKENIARLQEEKQTWEAYLAPVGGSFFPHAEA